MRQGGRRGRREGGISHLPTTGSKQVKCLQENSTFWYTCKEPLIVSCELSSIPPCLPPPTISLLSPSLLPSLLPLVQTYYPTCQNTFLKQGTTDSSSLSGHKANSTMGKLTCHRFQRNGQECMSVLVDLVASLVPGGPSHQRPADKVAIRRNYNCHC